MPLPAYPGSYGTRDVPNARSPAAADGSGRIEGQLGDAVLEHFDPQQAMEKKAAAQARRMEELSRRYGQVDENTDEVRNTWAGQGGTAKSAEDRVTVAERTGERLASAAMRRRGLAATSGYEQELVKHRMAAAAEERRAARTSAIEGAIGEVQGRIAGQATLEGLASGPLLQLTQAAESRREYELQRQQAALSSWLELGGLAGVAASGLGKNPDGLSYQPTEGYGKWSGNLPVPSSPQEIY